jgi:hypothetical protein
LPLSNGYWTGLRAVSELLLPVVSSHGVGKARFHCAPHGPLELQTGSAVGHRPRSPTRTRRLSRRWRTGTSQDWDSGRLGLLKTRSDSGRLGLEKTRTPKDSDSGRLGKTRTPAGKTRTPEDSDSERLGLHKTRTPEDRPPAGCPGGLGACQSTSQTLVKYRPSLCQTLVKYRSRPVHGGPRGRESGGGDDGGRQRPPPWSIDAAS